MQREGARRGGNKTYGGHGRVRNTRQTVAVSGLRCDRGTPLCIFPAHTQHIYVSHIYYSEKLNIATIYQEMILYLALTGSSQIHTEDPGTQGQTQTPLH